MTSTETNPLSLESTGDQAPVTEAVSSPGQETEPPSAPEPAVRTPASPGISDVIPDREDVDHPALYLNREVKPGGPELRFLDEALGTSTAPWRIAFTADSMVP